MSSSAIEAMELQREETSGSGPPVVVTGTPTRDIVHEEVATTTPRKRFWLGVGVFAMGLFGCGLISLGWGLYAAGVVHFILRDLNHKVKDTDELFEQNAQASVFAAKICLFWEALALLFGTVVLVTAIRAVFLLPKVAKHPHVHVMRSVVALLMGIALCFMQACILTLRSSVLSNVVNNYPLCE